MEASIEKRWKVNLDLEDCELVALYDLMVWAKDCTAEIQNVHVPAEEEEDMALYEMQVHLGRLTDVFGPVNVDIAEKICAVIGRAAGGIIL